jgi:Ca2+:H+ antiporter
MLTLAAITLILPAAYRTAAGGGEAEFGSLSIRISLVLLAVYAANLVFSLVTHAALFGGSHEEQGEEHAPAWSTGRSAGVLATATAAIAWMSEILVCAIERLRTHSAGTTRSWACSWRRSSATPRSTPPR